ncbi:DUF3299 domain-containing protein [Paraglaciecola polaris]|uniref:Lipoprotein, putative n=1 Tax=Paraglaciecola polaris LMG 21857 TaxID=1129793 RepID=K6ZGC0_9ALTE|nr:DUF3299 domain-containing protein [Paraglaciecola polaris]GAC35081.1 lipoprotein, putative [Paraglaciecola polaris LMG 21857]|tara:strand:+ start:4955 stop:5416 length:462 start_codon:yes stop_codon:yes gene_type:complete
MKYVVLLLAISSFAALGQQPQELFWEDMIPKNYIAPQEDVNHDGSMIQQSLDAPVVNELDGKLVKIPGFVVPLEGSSDTTTEFLLVPYFGACIHVPPPPPNQIVYVKFSTGVPIDNIYDAVWVTGTLATQVWQGDLATVGYTLQGIEVTPYDG